MPEQFLCKKLCFLLKPTLGFQTCPSVFLFSLLSSLHIPPPNHPTHIYKPKVYNTAGHKMYQKTYCWRFYDIKSVSDQKTDPVLYTPPTLEVGKQALVLPAVLTAAAMWNLWHQPGSFVLLGGSQSRVSAPAGPALLKNLLDMPIPEPHPRPIHEITWKPRYKTVVQTTGKWSH